MSQIIVRAILPTLIFTYCSACGEEPPARPNVAGKLETPIRVDFDDQPLREVLATIGKAVGVKVQIDEPSLKKADVENDTPITMSFKEPIAARIVLALVLGPRGLNYEVKEDSIRVGSNTDLAAYRKTYDLSHIVGRGAQVDSVVQEVVLLIRAMEGKVPGADARKAHSKGTTLVAEQPQKVHELIADTLYLVGEEYRKGKEEEELAARRKEAQRWNSATFRPVDEFSGTNVSAHLEAPIAEGCNQVYCASFQLAWSELIRLVGEPPQLQGDPPLAKLLNAAQIERETLSPDCYLAKFGPLRDEFVTELKESIERRFPNSALPLPTVDPAEPGYLLYAHLLKQLAFENDFERLQDGVEFRNGKHKTQVASFGVEKYEDAMVHTFGKQVTVLAYRDEHDFIVKLHPKGDQDEILLAMVPPQASLAKTVDEVLKRIKRGQEGAQRPHLESGESLTIPVLSLKVRRDYSELTGRPFLHAGEPAMIRQATQLISFRLNEQGAILESSAELEELLGIEVGEPPPIRHMVFDRPFLVMLRETGAKQPYLAMWIGNTELMEPKPADMVER